MAAQLGVGDKPRRQGYDGFVDLSKEIVRGRTSRQQRQTVADVLASLLPPGGPERFRKLFPFSRWSAEANAMFTMIGFGWLVGPMEVVEVEVTLPESWRGREGQPGDVQTWRSGVKCVPKLFFLFFFLRFCVLSLAVCEVLSAMPARKSRGGGRSVSIKAKRGSFQLTTGGKKKTSKT